MARFALLSLLLTLLASKALADKPGFGDTFTFSVGGMLHHANASFTATREGNPEVELDLKDLDMDTDATTLWLGFNWQLTDHWGLSGSYASFDSNGVAVVSESGNFDEIDWEVNATLDSQLDMDLYIVDLNWDLINNGRSHLGVGLGLHIADVSAGISAFADLDVNGNPIPPIDLGASATEVTAPLPNVLVRGGHRFGDSFYIGARLGYFALEVGDVDGELWSGAATAEWRPGGGNFGLGLGYQYVNVNVKQDKPRLFEEYDLKGDGPILFLSVGF
jgi:hypothetical protein